MRCPIHGLLIPCVRCLEKQAHRQAQHAKLGKLVDDGFWGAIQGKDPATRTPSAMGGGGS